METVDSVAYASTFVQVLDILIWPLIVLIAILVFGPSLREALPELIKRLKGISVKGVSLEFAQLAEWQFKWGGSIDFRKYGQASFFNSAAEDLILEMNKPDVKDYAVINLGFGREWLSSRLFIFALLLRRMRGVKFFVFTDAISGKSNRYIGFATLDQIRWMLAHRNPLLEESFSKAFTEIDNRKIRNANGALSTKSASQLLAHFLEYLQFSQEDVEKDAAKEKGYVLLSSSQEGGGQFYEHAIWLNSTIIKDFFDGILISQSIYLHQNEKKEKVLKKVIGFPYDPVPVINKAGQFQYLFNRTEILEGFVGQVVDFD